MSTRAPRVGLEVHVRLATASKLFCSCPNTAGGRPNADTCPVCAGLPGAMPTLNRRAVELALRAALLFNCDIAPEFAFDRKHYAYPDLPKGYQTTQARQPLATGGALELESGRRIALIGIHIEDDAGRSRHDAGATHVDLSRAGAPLVEIVTEPVLQDGDEVRDFLFRLREELRFAGVSDCDMEKGSLRCDVNVSLAAPGAPGFARVELKNLNSIRAAGEAVTSEFARQAKLLQALDANRGPGPINETRGWHAAGRRSFPMRAKEHATDYRFLPEPDLPSVRIDAADLTAIRAELPEGPAAIRARWREYGARHVLPACRSDASSSSASAASGKNVPGTVFPPAFARALTRRPVLAAYFDAVVAAGAPPLLAAKWITNELAAAGPGAEGKLCAAALAELLALLAGGELTRAGAERVMELQLAPGNAASARKIADDLGLLAHQADESTTALLERLVHAAIASSPDAAADFTAGNPQALDALVGAVMHAARGRLEGHAVREALYRALDA